MANSCSLEPGIGSQPLVRSTLPTVHGLSVSILRPTAAHDCATCIDRIVAVCVSAAGERGSTPAESAKEKALQKNSEGRGLGVGNRQTDSERLWLHTPLSILLQGLYPSLSVDRQINGDTITPNRARINATPRRTVLTVTCDGV